jgi:hypothetical protein
MVVHSVDFNSDKLINECIKNIHNYPKLEK